MANYTWRVGNGNFGTAANWGPSLVPGTTDTAFFGSGTGTITGTGLVDTLYFSDAGPQSWTIAGQITAQNAISVGSSGVGGAGQVAIATGGILTLANGFLTVANGTNATGTLTINSGGTVRSTLAPQSLNYLLNIGGFSTQSGTNGTVSVQGQGALLDLNGSGATLGLAGNGTLRITGGGVAKFGSPTPTTSTGTASLVVGRLGNGTLSVDGAGSALLLSGGFYSGVGSGTSSSITLSNGGTLTETSVDPLDGNQIGTSRVVNGIRYSGGTGTLGIASGSVATLANQLSIGVNGSIGVASVTDAGSLLSVNDVLTVGGGSTVPNGSGSLSISRGGTVRVTAATNTALNYLQAGSSANTTGTIAVTGTSSLLDVGQNAASIGNAGTGSLTVSAGATARSSTADSRVRAALSAGNAAGSVGTVTVTGAGSSYDSAGYTYFGRAGSGTLVVDQGGTFTGGSAATGDGVGPNASYAMTIGDATPALDVNGVPITAINIGGTGNAQVKNGATLHTRGDLFVGYRGGNGTLLLDGGSTATVDRNVAVGTGNERPGGTGAITVQGGSTLRSGGQHILANAGIALGSQAGTSGTITVTGSGSLLDANGDRIAVGSRAAGTLNVAAGATVLAGAAYSDAEAAFSVGGAAGAVGTVTITGATSQIVASGLAVLGGTNTGAGLTAGGTGTVMVNGGLFRASNLSMFSGSVFSLSSAGTGVIGSSAGTAGLLTVDNGSSIDGAGSIAAGLLNNGSVTARGGSLSVYENSLGTGIYGAESGTLNMIALGGHSYKFTGSAATIKVAYSGSAASTVAGFVGGDVFSVSAESASLAGNVLTARYSGGTATYTFTGLAGGTSLALTSDGTGGMKVIASPDILFDDAYYLARNPDVAAAGVDPYQHYLASGFREGRNPSAVFDTSYYLTRNQDVAAAGINPLLHFEASGYSEGRNPSAAFSLSDYLAANADVKAAGLNPLLHYVASGRAEGRAAFAVYDGPADPLLDAAYYYAANPDVRAAGVNATAHYHASGWREGRNPDALFDTSYYLTQNPDVRAAGIDPLAHFEASGWREGREPSLLFSDAKYLAAYPDIRAAGIDPLLHYLGSGQFEGRMTFLTGGAAPADPLVDATYYDRQLGATLIPGGAPGAQQAASSYDTTGWQRGLNPDAFFDTSYYLSHNPDVAAAHINPLAHYEVNGWHEGRDPSAQFSTSKYLAAYADVQAAGIDPMLHYVVNGQAEGRSAFPV